MGKIFYFEDYQTPIYSLKKYSRDILKRRISVGLIGLALTLGVSIPLSDYHPKDSKQVNTTQGGLESNVRNSLTIFGEGARSFPEDKNYSLKDK